MYIFLSGQKLIFENLYQDKNQQDQDFAQYITTTAICKTEFFVDNILLLGQKSVGQKIHFVCKYPKGQK